MTIASVDQVTFDKIWNGNPRFASLRGPDISGRQIEIHAPGYNRYMTGVAMEYEDGVVTIEIFTREQ